MSLSPTKYGNIGSWSTTAHIFRSWMLTWATEKKNSYFPLFWLFNRDPGSSYIMVYENNPPHNWVMFSPPIYPKQAGGPFFIAHMTPANTLYRWMLPSLNNCWSCLLGNTLQIFHVCLAIFFHFWVKNRRKKKRIAVWQLINHTPPT